MTARELIDLLFGCDPDSEVKVMTESGLRGIGLVTCDNEEIEPPSDPVLVVPATRGSITQFDCGGDLADDRTMQALRLILTISEELTVVINNRAGSGGLPLASVYTTDPRVTRAVEDAVRFANGGHGFEDADLFTTITQEV